MNPFAKFEKSKADKEPKGSKEGSKKDKFLEMIQAKKSGGKRKFSAGGYADSAMAGQSMPMQALGMPLQPQGLSTPQQAFKHGGTVRRGYGKARGA